jgi:hypothetical protein
MYGLSADFDPAFFIDRVLAQVRYGPYTVHLDFDQNLRVTIEAPYLLRRNDWDPGHVEEPPLTSSELMILTGKTVRAASAESDGTLTLQFESGASLELRDANAPYYESYQISFGGHEIIV